MEPSKRQLNYIYFGLLFFFLSFLHVYHIFLIENGTALHQLFYMIHAIGQCFLEVAGLCLIGDFLVKRFPRSLNPIFIIMTFILFLIHILDFPLVRLMDMSVWYGFDFISDESFGNFVELLYSTHIPLKTWLIIGACVVLFPILGVGFFRLTNAISSQKPLNVSHKTAGVSVLAVVLFLFLFDFRTGKLAALGEDIPFLKALPWKTTFFPSSSPILTLDSSLRPLPEKPPSISYSLRHKPNIFLFIIESLREDFLTPETAPTLAQFRKKNVSFDLSLANANGSAFSWFSIFHSRYPLYWGKMEQGSLPLKILKEAGYKIHLYSSSRLSFYGMDEAIFGPNYSLVDDLSLFEELDEPSCESDRLCFKKLNSNIKALGQEEGHLFLIFLESTHFDYSSPSIENPRFTPVEESIDYFKITCFSENMEGIKNRYRNSIFYVDTLFNDFYQNLMNSPSGEKAVIALTGDHGEEFFEEGCMFHASHLNTMQTEVPIYFRFGSSTFRPVQTKLASQVDIFPSIFHYLFGEDLFEGYFDGESIFNEKKKPFAVTTRFNASRVPFEFFIHNGKHKLTAQFINKRDIFQSKALQLLSKKDRQGHIVPFDLASTTEEFAPALEYLFPK